jgi:hypothetical protein
MLLTDLPWLWCAADVPAGAPDGPTHRPVGTDPVALARAAADLPAAGLVVVVPPDTLPTPVANGLSVAPAVVRAIATGQHALLWPAEDAVTGTLAVDHGIWLAASGVVAGSAQALATGTGAQALHPLVPPLAAAAWDGAASPATAFRAGHAAMGVPRTPGLALIASLGADHPQGDWWGIGAARALLGDTVEAAWAEDAAQAAGGLPPAVCRAELARQVRVRTGLAVHPFGPRAAAAVRAMRSPVAPPEVWNRYAARLETLLPGGAAHPATGGLRLVRALAWGRDQAGSAAAQGVQNGP